MGMSIKDISELTDLSETQIEELINHIDKNGKFPPKGKKT